MSIHTAITEARVDFETSTGTRAKSVYLGDQEITALLSWAHEQQYIMVEPSEAEITGESRPEVYGLKVYVVNDESHIQCA